MYKYAEKLLDEIVLDRDFTDCRFVCGGQEIRCHRVVLAESSPVRRAALGGNFRESHEATIAIEVANFSTLQALVKYIYTGTLEIAARAHSNVLFFLGNKKFQQ